MVAKKEIDFRKWMKGSDQIYVPAALTLKRENPVSRGSRVDVAIAEKGQIPHLRRPEARLTHILITAVTCHYIIVIIHET